MGIMGTIKGLFGGNKNAPPVGNTGLPGQPIPPVGTPPTTPGVPTTPPVGVPPAPQQPVTTPPVVPPVNPPIPQ